MDPLGSSGSSTDQSGIESLGSRTATGSLYSTRDAAE